MCHCHTCWDAGCRICYTSRFVSYVVSPPRAWVGLYSQRPPWRCRMGLRVGLRWVGLRSPRWGRWRGRIEQAREADGHALAVVVVWPGTGRGARARADRQLRARDVLCARARRRRRGCRAGAQLKRPQPAVTPPAHDDAVVARNGLAWCCEGASARGSVRQRVRCACLCTHTSCCRRRMYLRSGARGRDEQRPPRSL